MEVIPAIDLRGGSVVRLEQGDYKRETVYASDPGASAAEFAAAGIVRLHVVDLDGARAGRPENLRAVESILKAVAPLPVQLGGGLREMKDLETVLDLGVDRVILGTVALESPEFLRQAAERFPGRVALGIDARDGFVAVRGWLETSTRTVEEVVAEAAELSLAAIIHTDIARDGTLEGPNLGATVAVASATRHPVIASGGMSSIDDLVELAKTRVIAGAIVGRALYTGAIDLSDALRAVEASC